MHRSKLRSYTMKSPFHGSAWLFLACQLLLIRTGVVFTPPRTLDELLEVDPDIITKLATTLLKSLRGDVPADIKDEAMQDLCVHLLTRGPSGLTPLETFDLNKAHSKPRVLWAAHITKIFKSRLSNFINKAMPPKMSGAVSIQGTPDLPAEPGSKIMSENTLPTSFPNGEEQAILSETLHLGGQRIIRFKTFVIKHLPHPLLLSAVDLFLQDADLEDLRDSFQLEDSDFKDLQHRLKDLFTVFIFDEFNAVN